MRSDDFSYVETRQGIVTKNDVLFRTTEDSLKNYAGPVIEKVGLDALLEQAVRWVRASRIIGMIAFLVGALFLNIWGALLLGIGVFLVIELLIAPLFPLKTLIPAFRLLDAYWSEFVGAAIVFGWIGFQGDIQGALIGLGLFLLLRWALFRGLEAFVLRFVFSILYRLPFADQILRTVIVRRAVSLGIDLPELRDLEESARAVWRGSGN